MSDTTILALDQGTSNTKALLLDASGVITDRAIVPISCRYPRPGWVEQDPAEIWESVLRAIDELDASHLSKVAVIGLANQRESVALWERGTGDPIGPCVGWQCRRGAGIADSLRTESAARLVRATTGLPLDPAFSAPKIGWLLSQDPSLLPRAEKGELCVGTVDSWLLWNLTGHLVHATEPSNASRTLLFNIHTLDWDDELLDLFSIPRAALPHVVESAALHGTTASIRAIRQGVPIHAMLGDSQASLFRYDLGTGGQAKASYGTGTSVMTISESTEPRTGLLVTIAWQQDKTAYALEGNILSTGATTRWVADLLNLSGGGDEVARLARTGQPDRDIYLVPAFVGLGSPHDEPDIRGVLTGLTLKTGSADLARAALESTAYQVCDVVQAIEQHLATPISALWVDGAAAQNDWLMQFQADILGKSILRSRVPEAAALGVGYMAGLAAGVWVATEELSPQKDQFKRFEPVMDPEMRECLYDGWLAAIERARFRPAQPTPTLHGRQEATESTAVNLN